MNVFFTAMATEQMRQIQRQGIDDQKSLMSLLKALADVKNEPDPSRVTGVVRVADGPNGDVFVARAGNLRALLTTDPDARDSLVIANIYPAGDDEGVRLGRAINDVVEMAGVQ